MKLSEPIAGILIFISFLLTNYAYFINNNLFIFAGIFAWVALMILFHKIANKKLIYILLILTFCSIFISSYNHFEIDFKKAIVVNQYLLTLLIGVAFLRLVAIPKEEKIKQLPTGKSAFFKTYVGIHLFGSVINLSSLILVADKLYKNAPLSKIQIMVLTRAFSSDAYWSPFFVAFAAAMTYAPHLNSLTIIISGLFLALMAFFITYLEIHFDKNYDFKTFQGYPIHFETLYLPFLLAGMVLVTNHYYPLLKIIVLISFFSLILALVILPLKTTVQNSMRLFGKHITEELPKMKNELALFLVAGAFGVAISSILVGLNIQLPFDVFDAKVASVLLLILILLSFIGIHPIISIAVIGNWMNELNHTLLAMTFLMSWSTAVSSSPFSGVNLTMQSRYSLKALDMLKLNVSYTYKMYLLCVIVLFVLANYLKL
ncbi:MAG: tellurium resistance protein TerC [Candidatus Marinarcus sp.]|uniref:tellurium resistance protein TerC n=1 Tax=Candidatus Marinarcus sp. TaxID=3100987 RepID=UPI003B00645B